MRHFRRLQIQSEKKMCGELNLKGTYTVYAVNDSSAEQKDQDRKNTIVGLSIQRSFNNL